ncbi:MAG: hypothetical protein ACRCXZ_06475 [Patescibacteria group bacterium]
MKKLLEQITNAAKNNELSLNEIIQAYNEGVPKSSLKNETSINKPERSFGGYNFLIALSMVLLSGGFFSLVLSSWSDFSSMSKLFLSLGTGLILFYISTVANYKYPKSIIANTMIPISFVWLCWGVNHVLNSSSYKIDTKWVLSIVISFVLATIFFLLYDKDKISIYFNAFNLCFASLWSSVVFWYLNGFQGSFEPKYVAIAFGFLGASGLIIQYLYQEKLNIISRILNLVFYYGTLVVSSIATISLFVDNGYKGVLGSPQFFIELLIVGLFGLFFYFAVKSKSILLTLVNIIGVFGWLQYFSMKYFEQRNFSFFLILSGLLILLLGSAYIYSSKKISHL